MNSRNTFILLENDLIKNNNFIVGILDLNSEGLKWDLNSGANLEYNKTSFGEGIIDRESESQE